MIVKVIEATNNNFNYGKFMLCRFDREWSLRSNMPMFEVTERSIKCLLCGNISFNQNDIKEKYCGGCHAFLGESQKSLLWKLGWTPEHLWVLDLQTGEGAFFRPSSRASHKADLEKHRIWVCPLYESFLGWLYQQDLADLEKLPSFVNLPDAPGAIWGYRRSGGEK